MWATSGTNAWKSGTAPWGCSALKQAHPNRFRPEREGLDTCRLPAFHLAASLCVSGSWASATVIQAWSSYLAGEPLNAWLLAFASCLAWGLLGGLLLGNLAWGLGLVLARRGLSWNVQRRHLVSAAGAGLYLGAMAVTAWARTPLEARLLLLASTALLLLAASRHGIFRWSAWSAAMLLPMLSLARNWSVESDGDAVEQSSRDEPLQVLLVTLDTFRADHLGCIGGYWRQVETPNLDALAREGVLFTRGVAPVPLTLPAHAAVLTGEAPFQDGLLRNGQILPRSMGSVAQVFQASGFRTAAFVSASVLKGRTGLERGFDHYDDRMGLWDDLAGNGTGNCLLRLDLGLKRPASRRGDTTVERALRWLKAQDGSVFLWVHLYDPHWPYQPPAPYDNMYAWDDPSAPGNPQVVEEAREKARQTGFRQAELSLTTRDTRPQIASYAGEITWTDLLVGRLVEGLSPRARIVLVADHGESLDEHGYLLNHGSRLYEPSTRVPVILRAPGILPAGLVVEQPVSTTNVAGTLLLLGELEDPSRKPLQWTDAPWDREIVSYAPPQQSRVVLGAGRRHRVAFRRGSTKWIVDSNGGTECYRLDSDPGELNDISSTMPRQAAQERRRGVELIRSFRAAHRAQESDPSLDDALRSLGYLE